jgi:hypothetical protein
LSKALFGPLQFLRGHSLGLSFLSVLLVNVPRNTSLDHLW